MKRICFVVCFTMLAAFSVNAQFYAGGSIGFNTYGEKYEGGGPATEGDSHLIFSLAPKVGYMLSDDLSVGLKIELSSAKFKTPGFTNDIISKSTGFGIAPFARYTALRYNKLGLFAEGNLGFSTESNKRTIGSTTTELPTTNIFGISIFPGILYDLNERVQLEATIGGFNMGYFLETTKDKTANTTTKEYGFSFGANTNSIVTLGAIQIGAVIKF